MNIDWSKFLTVDDQLMIQTLIEFASKSEDKVNVAIYTVNYESQKNSDAEFIDLLKNSILKYVLNDHTIAAHQRNELDPLETAMEYFGKIDPSTDGKFGELILYLLVESILKVPLIAFKMTTSMQDQAKGSDGVFCGDYKGKNAILLGESKAWSDFGAALTDAFKSIYRFHGSERDYFLNQEFIVASASNRFDAKNLTQPEIDYIYDCLTYGGKVNKTLSLAHPILIIYDKVALSQIQIASVQDKKIKLAEVLENEIDYQLRKIKRRLNKNDYSAMKNTDLEFFMIPVESVANFRNDIFRAIHGKSWDEFKNDNTES